MTTPDRTSTRGLALGFALGLPIMAYGVAGTFVDAAETHPGELTRWIVGAAIVHDFMLVPMVLGIGILGRRLARDPAARRVLRAGLVVAGSIALVSIPYVRGYGRTPAIPSLLARNYAIGSAVYLGAVVALTTISAGWLTIRARPRQSNTERSERQP